MNFFCSKDCPDLCGMDIHSEENMISYRALPQLWSSPGFICAKFKDFATREINNGLLSWQIKNNEKQSYPDAITALSALADWLAPFRNKNILYLRGSGSLGYNMGYWDQLFAAFPHCVTVNSNPCNDTGGKAHELDFGCISNPCVTRLADAETIILYGKNAAVTSPHLYSYLKKLKKSGSEIILIDPVRTATASLADHYIQIQPACDGLLACALLTELGHARDYPIPQLLETAGVTHAEFTLLLDRLRNKKVAHIQGLGLQRQENGMNAMRWINRLAHFTAGVELLYYGHNSKHRWQPHPARFSKKISLDDIAVRLAAGEFDLFVNIAVNPAVTYADSNLWVRALNRTPTLVVDTNMTTTATYADFFLKVGGMFAQADFQNSYFFSHHYSRPAFTDELSDMQAARALAKKLNIPLIRTTEEELGAPAPVPRTYQTTTLDLHWPQEMRDFRLLTASHLDYLNSQIINGQEQGLQVIHINPLDAERKEIASGDRLRVEGDCGAFSAGALLTDAVPQGTLMCWKNLPMLDGFCNSAVPGRLTDGETGLAYYAAEVSIFKIDAA